MKINIGFTGISGMLGKNFLDYYLKNIYLQEKFNIVGFTRKEDKSFKSRYQREDNSIIIKTINYDDLINIKDSLNSIDILIHAAGVTKGFSYEQFLNGNYIVTKNLVEVITKEKLPIKKFIFISSQSVLGPSYDKFLNEDSDYNPISSYGKSKMQVEELLKESTLNWIIVRYPAIFGKYDMDSLMLFKIASKGIIIDTSWNQYILSYIFAQDAVRLLYDLIEKQQIDKKILHFCYDNPIKIRDFLRAIIKIKYKKGKRLILKIPIFKFIFRIATFIMTFVSYFNKKANIVNVEKLNEFLQTSWLLSNEKTKRLMDIDSIKQEARLDDIYNWYKEEGLVK